MIISYHSAKRLMEVAISDAYYFNFSQVKTTFGTFHFYPCTSITVTN